jgi:hypothetical protein
MILKEDVKQWIFLLYIGASERKLGETDICPSPGLLGKRKSNLKEGNKYTKY